jgi:hypothetical protein
MRAESSAHGRQNIMNFDDYGEAAAVISSTGIKYIMPQRSSRKASATIRHGKVVEESKLHEHHQDPKSSQVLAPVEQHNTTPLVEARKSGSSQIAVKRSTATLTNSTDSSTKVIHHGYTFFAIALSTFLVALVAFVVSLRKMNYNQEPEGAQSNPQSADDEPSREIGSSSSQHPGNEVPLRKQQVMISYIYILGSITFYFQLQVELMSIRNWFGIVSFLFWDIGFFLELLWLMSVGGSPTQKIAAVINIVACAVGQIQPISQIIGTDLWWPSVTTMVIWYMGSCVSCIDVLLNPGPHVSSSAGVLSHSNLVVTERFVEVTGALVLVIGTALATPWWGNPKKQLAAETNPAVFSCCWSGATLFLLKSCVRCEWCNGFRAWSNCADGTERAPSADSRLADSSR